MRHVAKLARLHVADEEVASLEKEMSAIVAMVEHLPALSGSGALLEPDNLMELREDVVTPSYPRKKILQNAPKAAEGCFEVPKTVE